MATDARLAAFLADGPEIFSSVQQGQTLWKRDPFDVESLNAPARSAFERLVKRAIRKPAPDSGRLLLLLGESGSGKTHLVRAFRNSVHSRGVGYVGYMPMTVDATHYDRHILSYFIDSLDRPYDSDAGEDSGLMRLSDAVMARCMSAFAPLIPEERILEDHELHDMIRSVADDLHALDDFRHIDVQLLRALICLQRREARFHHRILQWLRCEDLAPADRTVIGDLVPRTADDDPIRMMTHLGRLMGVMNQALVLCVDQVEDISDFEQSPRMEPSFRRAMNSFAALAAQVPTAIVVVCCLEDFWSKMRNQLNLAMRDRIEHDPEPVSLEVSVTAQTARDIAARRLSVLYAQSGLSPHPSDPTYPIPAKGFELLSGQRTRDVLNQCRRYRERAIQEEKLPKDFPLPIPGKGGGTQPPPAEVSPIQKTDQAWIDFRARFKDAIPEEDSDVAALLAWAIEMGGDELGGSTRFKVKPLDEESLNVTLQPGNTQMFVALCNRSPRGGGLGRQMADALRAAAGKLTVLVRTTDFPGTLGTLVADQTTMLMKKGGRRAVLGNSDLRELVALRSFQKEHPAPAFIEWSRATHPITRLKAISDVLALEKSPPPEPTRQLPPQPVSTAEGTSAPSVTKPVQGERRGAISESARRVDTRPDEKPAHVREPESSSEDSRAETALDGHQLTAIGPPLVSKVPGRTKTPVEVPQPQAIPPKPASDAKPGAMRMGISESVFTQPVFIQPDELTKHSAFLGGSGSGKTTLALNLIEQLLLQGIPALLVDRKGDLAAYARDEAWEEELKDPVLNERRRLLKERVDVALYTPGRSDGRPLAIPIVPRGLEVLPPEERDQSIQQAAEAIASMLEYKNSPRDKAAKALLAQALRMLVERPLGQELTLDLLQKFIASQDIALVQEVSGMDLKVFPKLAQDLTTLKLNTRTLLSNQGEKLDMEELLGRGSAKVPGRTRLSIISTKFLGGTQGSLFWVSQLLVEANRWASQHPSSRLQAVLLFDEADLYLPAMSMPATKQPMENLLKRARSAGIGVMLATQSPGDLDYKCRDNVRNWCVGRVKEETALKKLKPMFADARVDAAAKLPAQKQGQFHVLRDGQVEQLKADRNIIKTDQLSEDEILQLAHRSREQGQ
ncbi:ATP-binding protein [Corallococcus sp. CA047B]|uniref:ATP-binding protein n=1 Tax=Corallococcus sp. CA047B TaxID=2316729 RepID=UPI000EA06D16|nr:AAA family ATPase [Corallococcus sp. CA047B]RKH15033.1 ATP-binding protein [Corallococcus sp. CA047B]